MPVRPWVRPPLATAPPVSPWASRDVAASVRDAHPVASLVPISAERWSTPANMITAVRSVGAVSIAMASLATSDLRLLVVAYLVYWVLDVADGAVARRFDHETRLGAVFDIVGDRASALTCVCALVTLRQDLAVPLAIYAVEFAVVDTMLSLGFLGFASVKGPNDMHVVDPTLWRWNWSRPAKAINTGGVVALCLLGQPGPAAVCASVVLALKIWSCCRLRRALRDIVPSLP